MITAFLFPHFLTALMQKSAGNPLIITTEAGRRVLATCPQATARGVQPGMTPRQAQALCPEAQLISYDADAHREQIDRILDLLSEFSPYVEHEGETDLMKRRNRSHRAADTRQIAVFYADLGKLPLIELRKMAKEMVALIDERIRVPVSAGLATSKFTAFAAAASTEISKLCLIHRHETVSFLATLPLALLWLDAETHRLLTILGLDTLGKIAAQSRAAIYQRFGKRGVRFWELPQGIDPRPVEVYRPRRSERITRYLEYVLTTQSAVDALLTQLSASLAHRLQRRGLMVCTLIVTFLLGNNTRRTVQQRLRQPVAGAVAIAEAICTLSRRIHTGPHGITGVDLTLTDLTPFTGIQLPLFPTSDSRREELNEALISLMQWFGSDGFFWIEQGDKHARLADRRYIYERVTKP